jgi:hypothetical protein
VPARSQGDATVVQQVIKAGLLDELQVHLTPVLLGKGRRLFDHLGAGHIELERISGSDSPDPVSAMRNGRSLPEAAVVVPRFREELVQMRSKRETFATKTTAPPTSTSKFSGI